MPIADETWRGYISDRPTGIKRKTVFTGTLASVTPNTVTVPGHEIWHPLAIRINYVHSAVAGLRTSRVEFGFGDGTNWRLSPGTALDASISYAVRYWAGVLSLVSNDGIASPNQSVYANIPDLLLLPGNTIQLQLVNTQAGDTASNFGVLTEFMAYREGEPPHETVVVRDETEDVAHALELDRMGALR